MVVVAGRGSERRKCREEVVECLCAVPTFEVVSVCGGLVCAAERHPWNLVLVSGVASIDFLGVLILLVVGIIHRVNLDNESAVGVLSKMLEVLVVVTVAGTFEC